MNSFEIPVGSRQENAGSKYYFVTVETSIGDMEFTDSIIVVDNGEGIEAAVQDVLSNWYSDGVYDAELRMWYFENVGAYVQAWTPELVPEEHYEVLKQYITVFFGGE